MKVGVRVRFYFAVVLRNFSQIYAFCIQQMRDGNGVRIKVRLLLVLLSGFIL